MAGSKFFALLDDIAAILDDVAVMSKVAAKKTAGLVGDDLALGAEQVTGVHVDRELPVVWAVAKGSFKNKLILVPAALLISAVAPWAILPLLMLGGAYLCFEGFEKVAHKLRPPSPEDNEEKAKLFEALTDPSIDMVAFEKTKIEGAIRTDFILSAEIVVIVLGTVAAASFWMRVAVLTIVAILITVGVYGLVAGIVRLDDLGLRLCKKTGDDASSRFQRRLGHWILKMAPTLMKTLSVVGTAAMFTVGGGILAHGIPPLHSLLHSIAHTLGSLPSVLGGVLGFLAPILLEAFVGLLAGALLVGLLLLAQRLFSSKPPPSPPPPLP